MESNQQGTPRVILMRNGRPEQGKDAVAGGLHDVASIVLGGIDHQFQCRIDDGAGAEITVGPGTLIGELALVVPMKRPASATALEYSSVVRITRSLFQRVLESDPAAARRHGTRQPPRRPP